MAPARKKKKPSSSRKKSSKAAYVPESRLKQEAAGWLVVLVLLLLTLGIYLKGAMGSFGVLINSVFVGLFGVGAYLISAYSLVLALINLFVVFSKKTWIKVVAGYLALLLVCALWHITGGSALNTPALMYSGAGVRTGGLIGGLIGGGLMSLIGKTGAIVLVIFGLLLVILITTERSIVEGMRFAGRRTKEQTAKITAGASERAQALREKREQLRKAREEEKALAKEQEEKESAELSKQEKAAYPGSMGESLEYSIDSSDEIQIRLRGDITYPEGSASPPPREAEETEDTEEILELAGEKHFERRTPIHDGVLELPTDRQDPYLEKKRRHSQQETDPSADPEKREDPYGSCPKNDPALSGQELEGEDLSENPVPEDVLGEEALDERPTRVPLSFAKEYQNQAGRALRQESEKEPAALESPEPARQIDDQESISTEKLGEFPEDPENQGTVSGKSSSGKPDVSVKKPGPTGRYHFPPIALLSKGKADAQKTSREELLQSAKSLEEALFTYGVEAKVVQVNRGPAVTRYELQPKVGTSVRRITALDDDIAMTLAATSIHIEAPIPGKSLVGIEIPNKETSTVTLREVIDSETFKKASSKVTFALGKDIDGEPRVADIAKMPHLLIAGATGSGKSVCINSLIISLLYKADPNEVKLILIDPKVVELSVYNGIPHLLLPVVNEPRRASATLNWAVSEMTRRYKQFAEHNVRDIRGYNDMVEERRQQRIEENEQPLSKMPQIVIVIDELADLMMVAAKEVETSICRLAQMARAAGMHLVIATQRPSVDVITGLIKANIPSRIAFAVSSGVDSKTILDGVGAEKLLGRGDMLFAPLSSPRAVRIQGTFVSDQEVEAVTEYVKKHGTASYDEELSRALEQGKNAESNDGIDEEVDEYLEDARVFVIQSQKASISLLQRKFRIGFNRAARIIDALAEMGVIGPDEGSKGRQVLLTPDDL